MKTITADMSIRDVLEIDETTADILLGYGMHCIGCPHAAAESLEEAGSVHGIDIDEMIAKLNEHVNADAK